jgi:hypothetical protein
VYVYFRYNEKESVMVIINSNEKESKIIKGENYSESLAAFTGGIDIISGKKTEDLESFSIPPASAMIIELK